MKERNAKVTRRRPADENHEVITVVSNLAGQHQCVAKPCRQCPWRKDAVGVFPAEAFRHSAPTSYDMADRTFGCHSSDHQNPKTCAGFLLSTGAGHNMRVRINRIKFGKEQVSDSGLDLFKSYRDMAVANGVDPDDPVLEPCL